MWGCCSFGLFAWLAIEGARRFLLGGEGDDGVGIGVWVVEMTSVGSVDVIEFGALSSADDGTWSNTISTYLQHKHKGQWIYHRRRWATPTGTGTDHSTGSQFTSLLEMLTESICTQWSGGSRGRSPQLLKLTNSGIWCYAAHLDCLFNPFWDLTDPFPPLASLSSTSKTGSSEMPMRLPWTQNATLTQNTARSNVLGVYVPSPPHCCCKHPHQCSSNSTAHSVSSCQGSLSISMSPKGCHTVWYVQRLPATGLIFARKWVARATVVHLVRGCQPVWMFI